MKLFLCTWSNNFGLDCCIIAAKDLASAHVIATECAYIWEKFELNEIITPCAFNNYSVTPLIIISEPFKAKTKFIDEEKDCLFILVRTINNEVYSVLYHEYGLNPYSDVDLEDFEY